MLPVRHTFHSENFRGLPDSRPLLAWNSRALHGYLGVLFKHRNVGHRQKCNPALPVLSQRPLLPSKRISQLSTPHCIVEPNDMGHSGVQAIISHLLCTSSCRRVTGAYLVFLRTFPSLLLALNHLFHLVLYAHVCPNT